jgi:hypothetical protein
LNPEPEPYGTTIVLEVVVVVFGTVVFGTVDFGTVVDVVLEVVVV